jgi:hypothetical protein
MNHQKTLVIILSETRCHELTFDNFKKNVIDELSADLCVCIGVKNDYDYNNPYYTLAKHRFLYNEEDDKNFAKSVEYSYKNTEVASDQKHYLYFLMLKDRVFTETSNPDSFTNFSISTYIHTFFLWFLHRNMKKFRILEKYDRFIISRSDYLYKLPFPKMKHLDPKYIWIPDGEDYYGICDRTVVLSRQNFEPYVNILESFYKKSNKYYKNIESKKNWNMEQILKMHLEENDVFSLVQRYPYISYCIRNINGATRWEAGKFSEKLGYFIKYPKEEQRASHHETEFLKSCVSIDEFYAEAIKI